MKCYAACCAVFCAVFTLTTTAGDAHKETPIPAEIRFNRDIRPILSENCFNCHGPDKAARKGKLRLDTLEGATAEIDGEHAIVPGNVEKSLLFKRVMTTDAEEHMPPAKSEKKLTERQVATLKKWIEQGAKWDKLWSFIPPQRPEVSAVGDAKWPRNPIDNFVLARLEKEGLAPRPEAERFRLIRRLSLDLTGLPPLPEEVDAFMADKSPQAYENLVDRLLANPHYGERMALEWLDAARFADTHGYHIDSGRDMSRWREWVIEAFNTNMPFDQFTIEQLAGDLLPNATIKQRVASGFNRNNMINFEGGANAQEYLTAYIIDRVNTTTTVWLGLTVACAQCHDHKYDPITQKEFYQFYAFFNAVPENGLDGSKGNAAPLVRAPSTEQQHKMDELTQSIKDLEAKIAGPQAEVDAAQLTWEKTAAEEKPLAWATLDPKEIKSQGGATFEKQADHSVHVGGQNAPNDTYSIALQTELKEITAIRLETLPDNTLSEKGPGRSSNGNVVLSEVTLSVKTGEGAAKTVKFKSASADFSQKDFPVENVIDGKPDSGWAIYPETGKPHSITLDLDSALKLDANSVLTLNLEFKSQFAQHTLGNFRVSLTDAKDPNGAKKMPQNVAAALQLAPEKRSEKQKADVRMFYRTNHAPALKLLNDELAAQKKVLAEYDKKIPSTMVMEEMGKPRDSFILMRGQFDQHGEKVTPGTPASLPPLPKEVPANRLALARWLVDPGHPLTARVIVNRYWQMYFGTGLVKTSEDFGSQGEQPSHPELLDWLATEFLQSGWDVKKMQRLILTSAAYRQQAVVAPEIHARDPENRLLAHGPRIRLQAEFIRDQALAVSGLLNPQIGGQSVSPYQPPGLWEELMSRADGKNWTAQTYTQSHGEDLYRRTMYTFWKRTSPPPTLSTFDAPDRETCTVRRARTNTPLQALVLMNDPTYVESSRKLAERMMLEGGATPQDRIRFAFKLATARAPADAELAVLERVFTKQLTTYKQNAEAAQKLLKVGEAPRNEKLDTAELAAWAVVASVIINLDETVTKQ